MFCKTGKRCSTKKGERSENEAHRENTKNKYIYFLANFYMNSLSFYSRSLRRNVGKRAHHLQSTAVSLQRLACTAVPVRHYNPNTPVVIPANVHYITVVTDVRYWTVLQDMQEIYVNIR